MQEYTLDNGRSLALCVMYVPSDGGSHSLLFKHFEFYKKFLDNLHIDRALTDRISQKVKENLVVLETPQPSHRRINMVKGEISSEVEVDELIKIFKEPPNQIVMRIINNQELPRSRNYYQDLGITTLDQPFLTCSMRKETSILKLCILVALSMKGT